MSQHTLPTGDHDPFIHLEELNDETFSWAQKRTQQSLNTFGGKRFKRHLDETDAIMSAKDKLVVGTRRGDYVYDFYADGTHPRGLWRRTRKENYDAYTNDANAPEWEVLVDIAALSAQEKQPWVYGGMKICHDGYNRALLTLRLGGSDTTTVREYDLTTGTFVSDGFIKPLGKGDIRWLNRDTVLIAHTFQDSTTRAGYPQSVRLWKRGTPLDTAHIILEGKHTDTLIGGHNFNTKGYEKTVVFRARNLRDHELYNMNRSTYELTRIQAPTSANCGAVRDWLTVELRENWALDGIVFTAGSLLALPYADALSKPVAARVHKIFEPTDDSSLLSYSATKSGIMFTVLNNVRTELYFAHDLGKRWDVHRLEPAVGEFNNIRIQPVNPDIRDGVHLLVTGFLTPPTLYRGSFVDGFTADHFTLRKLRSAPARFDASGLEVRQRWATSHDGTQIPYFAVGTPSALNGTAPAPTLLSAYGGFQVKNTPSYSSLYGKGLLEKGYVYALANIRGGGEFGPRWHQAALKENRHKAFEDFAAVARDLVDARITTVPQLAAIGGSNGGLLIGNMYTHYPNLFGALVCQVPLLDMKRYSHLLAGASWVSEYGDPDTSDWDYLQEFSPYHNVNPADVHPTLLLTTSTKDDRVHPAHARKFMALLESLGKPVHYFENIEGGHSGAADIKQKAYIYAMLFTYLDNAILP